MTSTDLFVRMVIDRWNGSIANLDKHLNALSDQQLQQEIARVKTGALIF